MAIRVRHEVPIAESAAVMQQIGTNQGLGQGAELDQRRAEFLLNLGQRKDEFAVNTALRVNEQDQQQRAMQDATQQRQAYDREASRQATFANNRAAEEFDYYKQQQGEKADWQVAQSKTLDEQVDDRLKEFRKLKLSPEGQRILNEYSGKRRQIQGELLLPAARQQALAMLMSDLEGAGLDDYAEHVPSAEEKVYQGLVPLQGQQVVPGQPLPPGKYRSLKGTRNGADTWETLDIPPEETVTAAERFQRDMVPTPDGGFALWNPESKKWDYQAPVKKEASKEPVLDHKDYATIREKMVNELFKEYEADLQEVMESSTSKDGTKVKVGTGEFRHPSGLTFAEYRKKNWPDKKAEWNQDRGDPEEETLIPSELRGATLGSQIDAPLSIDMGGSPTDFGETNPGMSEPQAKGAGTEADPIDLSRVDDDTVAALYQNAPSGTFFIDPDDGQLKQKP
jgi:hypothetical protein